MEKTYSLVGIDGNAFSIMAYVSKAMKENGFSKEDIDNYYSEAMSGNYNNLLMVSMKIIDEINEMN